MRPFLDDPHVCSRCDRARSAHDVPMRFDCCPVRSTRKRREGRQTVIAGRQGRPAIGGDSEKFPVENHWVRGSSP